MVELISTKFKNTKFSNMVQNSVDSDPGSDAAYYCTYVERDIEIYSNLHSCDTVDYRF